MTLHRATNTLPPHPQGSVPPGWEGNPSAWSHRLPFVGLASLGFCIAVYLSLYQLDLVGSVWDPFFGEGSQSVLDSRLSRSLPFPDAALGALGYLAEAVAGLVGASDRWRSMPWMVILYGAIAAALGISGTVLAILQPDVVGHWCALCLASALISVSLAGPAIDESLASLQYLARTAWSGKRSVWSALLGGPVWGSP